MSDQKNVHPYRRKSLEPEIAAMSVGITNDQNPTLIVNISDPAAKSAIRKVIIWIGSLGGLAEWLRRTARKRPAVTALAGTVLATTAATTAFSAVLAINEEPRPPLAAIERVVTLPPPILPAQTVTATRTVSTRPKPSRSSPAKPATLSPPPSRTRNPAPARSSPPATPPVVQPSSKSRTRRSMTPTPRPSKGAATTAPAVEPSPSDGAGGGPIAADRSTASHARSASASPSQSSEAFPPESDQEWSEQPPTAMAHDCGGLLDVQLDPLLDLCVLG